MIYQKERGGWRRFFERLENRVGRRAVHLVQRIDYSDSPTAHGGLEGEELIETANLIDRDILLQLALVVHFAS